MHVFAKPVPEKSDGQVLAALSTAAGQHLTAVLRSHALQKAMNAAALTLLRLEVCFISYSLLQSFPNTGHFLAIYAWQMPVDTGATLQTLIIAQGGKFVNSKPRKIHAAIQCQAQRIGFCALRGRAQRTNRCKQARCEVWIWWNVGSKPAFLPYFQLLLPISWKIVPYYNCIGVNLCYTISVSLCLKIGRAGFRACFPRVDTAVLADRERQHLPRSRRLLHAPPACPRILGRAAIPCRMQPEFCGTMRRSYFIIMGGRLVFCLQKLGGSLRGGSALP